MRKTLTLTVDQNMAEFIDQQPGMVDPSAFISRLIYEDMKKKGFQLTPATKEALHDDVIQELELMTDRNIPAAG